MKNHDVYDAARHLSRAILSSEAAQAFFDLDEDGKGRAKAELLSLMKDALSVAEMGVIAEISDLSELADEFESGGSVCGGCGRHN